MAKRGEVLPQQQQPREHEGGDHGENARIPELLFRQMLQPGGALGQAKRKHESKRREGAKGGQEEMSMMKQVRMHWLESIGRARQRAPQIRGKNGI